MFHYNLVNIPSFEVDKEVLNKISKTVEKIVKKAQSWTLNIVFLNPEEVKILNKEHRGIDKTTDVLSFHYFYDFKKFKEDETVWEIILNEEKIFSQSKEYKITVEKEFFNLVIHSTLHILGYDHEIDEDYKIMYDFECKVWEEVFNEKKV